MGVRVVVGAGESIEAALRRLRKQAEREGVAREVRHHAWFVRGTEVRRAKAFGKRFTTREAALVARMREGLKGLALHRALREFWHRTGKP